MSFTQDVHDAITHQYLYTMLWSDSRSETDDTSILETHSVDEVDAGARAEVRADVSQFIFALVTSGDAKALQMVVENPEQAGHDLFMTRNGHGCGFWDGDWDPCGDVLTRIAKDMGEQHAYVGEDDYVYVE
jgi:hypothetical protein